MSGLFGTTDDPQSTLSGPEPLVEGAAVGGVSQPADITPSDSGGLGSINPGRYFESAGGVTAALNHAPVIQPMSLAADKGVPLTAAFAGLDADGNPLTFSVVQAPVNGTVSIDNVQGTFTYTSSRTVVRGSDYFLVKASDGQADSNIAKISITIQEYLANAPIGEAQGLHPGRVSWVYNPAAAHWDGTTGYWWQDTNTDQAQVTSMVAQAVQQLTGQATAAAAWGALFRYFNQTHGRGDVGYTPGEKIAVKINLNNNFVDSPANSNTLDASPQMVYGLIDQLVNQAGVQQSDIIIYDAVRAIPDKIYNKCVATFPNVVFEDLLGGNGRRAATWVDALHYSMPNTTNGTYLPQDIANATCLVNMAMLKGHGGSGVTLTGKNHYGSISNGRQTSTAIGGAHDHTYVYSLNQPMQTYSPLVDLTASPYLGGKTLLYLIDALYGSRNVGVPPVKFQQAPFNNNWTSSLFASQDSVAIDSVGLDVLATEFGMSVRDMEKSDNYLHEEALANNAPSGIVYKPDGVHPLAASLGVHEHWNNATDKKYSRNLGTGAGIELVTSFTPNDTTGPSAPGTLTATPASATQINLAWTAAADAESGVTYYRIYRNGAALGTTTSNSYQDKGLTDNTSYTYAVSAVNGAAVEGVLSTAIAATTPADTTRPTLQSIKAAGTNTVLVVFSEPVEARSAEDPANFTLDHGATISSAQLDPNGTTVRLTTSTLSPGTTYTLSVSNVCDQSQAANTIAPATTVSFFNAAPAAGLPYAYYTGTWTALPDFSTLTPVTTGVAHNIETGYRQANIRYGLKFSGKINIAVAGSYTFYMISNDGSKLYIDGQEALSMDGTASQERSCTVALDAGLHDMAFAYYQNSTSFWLDASWSGPGFDRQPIPDSVLCYAPAVTAINDPPVRTAGAVNPLSITKNSPATALGLGSLAYSAGGGTDETGQSLTYTVTSIPAGTRGTILLADGVTAVAANRTYTLNQMQGMQFRPTVDYYGSPVWFTFKIQDSGGTANGGVDTLYEFVPIVVQDNLPTINPVPDPWTIPRNSGQQTVALSGITAGAGESQVLTVTATSSNAALIPDPTVAYTSPNSTATLTYTPVANATGSATITVTVGDRGPDGVDGTQDDNDVALSYTVTVTSANNAPTIAPISNPAAILENAGQQTVNLAGVTAGAGENQTLTVTATSSNEALIPNPTVTYSSSNSTGSLTYSPQANRNGTATITVTVRDFGYDCIFGTSDDGIATQTFTITVNPVNDPPTVDAAACAIFNPVMGDSTTLSALGADIDSGEASLTYTWTTTGIPPAPVNFNINGTNAAKSATATFSKTGTYSFLVTIADPDGLTATSSVTVTVNQTITSISISPATANLFGLQTQPFSATAKDQFGDDLTSQPAFAWSATAGSITSPGGLYTAPITDATATITVTSGGASGAGTVYVTGLPQITTWTSIRTHGSSVGDAALTIADTGTFSEPRNGGVRRLVVTFDHAIASNSFTASSVLMAGNDLSGAALNLSSIVLTTSLASSNTQAVIDFGSALPDRAKYLVRLQGVTDATGHTLYGDSDRIFTNLKGDANGDLRTNVTDLSYIQSGSANPINKLTAKQVRSDINLDGRVNATDLSVSWAVRNTDTRYIPTPVLGAGAAATWSVSTTPKVLVTTKPPVGYSPVVSAVDTLLAADSSDESTGSIEPISSTPLGAQVVDAALGRLL